MFLARVCRSIFCRTLRFPRISLKLIHLLLSRNILEIALGCQFSTISTDLNIRLFWNPWTYPSSTASNATSTILRWKFIHQANLHLRFSSFRNAWRVLFCFRSFILFADDEGNEKLVRVVVKLAQRGGEESDLVHEAEVYRSLKKSNMEYHT